MGVEGDVMAKRRTRPRFPLEGVVFPTDLEGRYGCSSDTVRRWERDGRLPARDVRIGGKTKGWKLETIEAAERAEAQAA